MTRHIWLNVRDCHAIQATSLQRFGGLEGIRDEGMLEAAVCRPQQLDHYGEPTIFDLAASYAFGIIKNHPFIDGNKRCGFLMAAMFLECNGYWVRASEEEAVFFTLGLAASDISEAKYAAWLERNCLKAQA